MYTITISGFETREELIHWVEIQWNLHIGDECPFNMKEKNYICEKVRFKNNLNKKNFDLEIEKDYSNENNDLSEEKI